MKRLDPAKLHVTFLVGVGPAAPICPRCYTLTHSDLTGDLFLSIGPDYDRRKTAQWYTRFMRDEVLAEWHSEKDNFVLVVHCHVSGGVVFGSAGLRSSIFRRELPLALESIRFGDRWLFDTHLWLDRAKVLVNFHAREAHYNTVEDWGHAGDYA